MSKVFDYATAFYNALDGAATTENINSKNVRVFRGSIVKAFRSLQISQAHYSEVRRGLINSECIAILQQGSRNTTSIVVLYHPPDEEGFKAAQSLDLTNSVEAATMTQTIEDIRRQLGGINILEAFITMDQKIVELDNRITKLEQFPTKSKGR